MSFTIRSRDFVIAPLVRGYETAATNNEFVKMVFPKMNHAKFMNVEEHVRYWLDSAQNDLEAAEQLFSSAKYD